MEEDEGIGNVAPGHHFRPFPKELVEFYLRPRLLNQPLPNQAIKELNLYDFHPRDILGNTPPGKHLYFFTPRKKKYPNGTMPARGTKGGYWKASGKDTIIRNKYANEIGRKKSLVFYEGHQRNGTRTRWLMQEYTIKEFWFPTNQNKDELGALALCEIYLKPTPNQSRDGKLQVDEQEVEEEGSPSPSSDNIFADRRVRPRPPPCNHGKDAPVASTSGCPSATARPGPSMPSMGYNNLWSHNMVLIPQSSLRPGGPQAMGGYRSSHQIRPLPAHHRQPGHVARSSGFGNAGGLLLHTMSPMQPGVLVHSSYCHCVVSAPSPQFGSSAISSFRNQLVPPNIAASSSQYQLPLQFNFEARQSMSSDSKTSPQTTLWPLPSHLS
ncbi:NAC transcription factor 32-like [Phoenix dactylifera]|uniref:NAC transcription factor 32-like n=1 Tax=Phoenix dactylifera TaxID=42345 RepID=A0A8B7CWG2_PHODC|nr:NAC transcription factor 32-like [Phoenix dactylifera]